MKGKYLFLLIFCSLGMKSCSDHALMDKNIAIDNNLWLNKQVPELDVDIKDTTISYKLYLNLRNTMDYPFSNIYVLVHQKNPDSTKNSYRVKVTLADKEGLWLGNSAASIFSHQVLFLKDYYFPDSGTYTFQFEQNMRIDPLPGIADAGLRVEPND